MLSSSPPLPPNEVRESRERGPGGEGLWEELADGQPGRPTEEVDRRDDLEAERHLDAIRNDSCVPQSVNGGSCADRLRRGRVRGGDEKRKSDHQVFHRCCPLVASILSPALPAQRRFPVGPCHRFLNTSTSDGTYRYDRRVWSYCLQQAFVKLAAIACTVIRVQLGTRCRCSSSSASDRG